MPLYGCLTPDGYKNTEAAWLNPEGMTRRINFVTALATGRLAIDRPAPVQPAPTVMVASANHGGSAGARLRNRRNARRRCRPCRCSRRSVRRSATRRAA